MSLPLHVALLVLLAAALHAGWNAVVKGSEDRVLTMATVIGVGAVLVVPLLPIVAPPAPQSWGFLLLSAALHVGYFFFLLQAYRVGDLSHVYPVARGTAPLLVAAGAALVASESLGAPALVGLCIASGAIASFALDGGRTKLRDPRPILYGLGTALFISAYTINDGLGVRLSGSPLGYIAWLFFIDGFPLVFYAVATRRDRILPYLRANWRFGLVGGTMCACAYGLVIWALGQGFMAGVSALRETGVVFAVLIGSRLLNEPFGRKRLVAAALVAFGLALLHLTD